MKQRKKTGSHTYLIINRLVNIYSKSTQLRESYKSIMSFFFPIYFLGSYVLLRKSLNFRALIVRGPPLLLFEK